MRGGEVRKAERSEMQRGQKGREEEESHVIAFRRRSTQICESLL